MNKIDIKGLDFALRPDAQGFDEIRLKTKPRFKRSEMSGSEWRTSTVIEFYRKGELILTETVGNIEVGCGMLYAKYIEAIDNGNGFFAGDGIHCDQEGCSNKAYYVFRLKKVYCSVGGGCGQEKKLSYHPHRCFCPEHKDRGDQDKEDCNSNYELIGTL